MKRMTKKNIKRATKYVKRRSTSKKSSSKTLKRKQRGGGCPCELGVGGTKNENFLMTGGGYGSSLQPIPLRNFYELNSYANDPSISAASSRNLPDMKGGRRRRNRKQSGGNSNVIEYTGTTSGAFLGRNLINGVTTVDPAPYVQPTLNINAHPMV